MRLKRLQRQKAAQLERSRDESSSEVSKGKKTRDKSRAGKAKTWGDGDTSFVDVCDTTIDSSDVSDMTCMPEELTAEPEQQSGPAIKEPVQGATGTTVTIEEKHPDNQTVDRSLKQKRTVPVKDLIIKETGEESFLVLNPSPTYGNVKIDEQVKVDVKLKTPVARKRRSVRRGSSKAYFATVAPLNITSVDNEVHGATSELSPVMHEITTTPESLTTATEGSITTSVASRVTVAAPALGAPCSSSFSVASSVIPTGARSIVSASETVKKLLERSPTCTPSELGAGHFIATRQDGRTLLIRRTETSFKTDFGSPSKGKYYLVNTEQKAYLVPVDKVQVQQSEKLMLVPTSTGAKPCAVDSSASVSRKSPPYQVGQGERNTKTVVTPLASSHDTADAQSTKSPEAPKDDYEPAVAGMRQEDRISLLKEKLQFQQQKVEQMRKTKVD